MESPIVKTVLSTGVDRQNVMQAIERRLRETGKGYIDRVSLISLRSCFLKLVQNSKIDCILTLKAQKKVYIKMRQPLIFYPGDTYSNADELLNVVLSYQQNFVSHQGNNNAKPDQIFFANLLVTCAFTFFQTICVQSQNLFRKGVFTVDFFLKRRECNQCDKFNIFYI